EPEAEGIININDAICTSARLVGNAIKNATDHFQLDLCAEMPLIRGSLQRIEQVMVNLILNSCQALPAKDRGIRIATVYHPGAGECFVTIADEGVGIPGEYLAKITDPFFTTKRTQGGTGLGLSISMRIVRDLKGALSFNSKVGEGTTVTLTIPVYKEAMSA
ncbi:MAG TPA: histidine kinase, partial [Desulfuromonas sp.]|nr:histidine kinase [Desulfuromonas sp.]